MQVRNLGPHRWLAENTRRPCSVLRQPRHVRPGAGDSCPQGRHPEPLGLLDGLVPQVSDQAHEKTQRRIIVALTNQKQEEQKRFETISNMTQRNFQKERHHETNC